MKNVILKNRLIATLIAIPLLLILAFALFLFIFFGKDIYTNNRRLDKFHQQHLDLAHMPGSEIVYDYKKSGILEGNSNHCDLGTVLVYKANVDYQEFVDFYRNLRINGYNEVNGEFDEEQAFSTLELKEGEKVDYSENFLIDFGLIKNYLAEDEKFQKILANEKTVYVAWARDYNSPNNDPSCH